MKKFFEAEINVNAFEVEDVITTSGPIVPDCPNETPEEEL